MRICLVGPGIMPIPPNGWGAVEMLIWDCYNVLKDEHEVVIVNTSDKNEIVNIVNSGNFDVTHVHYDVFSDLMPHIKSKVKILSSHYPYISRTDRWINDGYNNQIRNIVSNEDFHIFASSQNDINTFVKFGANPNNCFHSRLGVKVDSYEYDDCSTYDRTLCFSQIVDRKRQYLIQDLDDVDFFGRLDDVNFRSNNYKGEVPRDFLNSEITKYSNFTLLSSIENTTPLAVKEALICGLGVVVTKPVALELDTDLDFITIVEEPMIYDKKHISELIVENRRISKQMRSQIRDYAVRTFGIDSILREEYVKKIETLL